MEISHFTKEQKHCAVRFLKTVATVEHHLPLSELETTCINAIQYNIYLCEYTLSDLEVISEEELAATITDAKDRLELVRAAMFLIAAESHIDPQKMEVLKSLTAALQAEETNSVDQQRTGWQAILDNFKKYVESK